MQRGNGGLKSFGNYAVTRSFLSFFLNQGSMYYALGLHFQCIFSEIWENSGGVTQLYSFTTSCKFWRSQKSIKRISLVALHFTKPSAAFKASCAKRSPNKLWIKTIHVRTTYHYSSKKIDSLMCKICQNALREVIAFNYVNIKTIKSLIDGVRPH